MVKSHCFHPAHSDIWTYFFLLVSHMGAEKILVLFGNKNSQISISTKSGPSSFCLKPFNNLFHALHVLYDNSN